MAFLLLIHKLQESRSLMKKNQQYIKSQISYDILAYLVDHPEAQDTFDGIIEWWLPDQIIKQMNNRSKPIVQEAVNTLVEKKLITISKGGDSQIRYKLNMKMNHEIQGILKQSTYD